jgi:hypothetical protein
MNVFMNFTAVQFSSSFRHWSGEKTPLQAFLEETSKDFYSLRKAGQEKC